MDFKLPNSYNIYDQNDDTRTYQEQSDEDDVYTPPTETTTTTTTIATTTTTTRPTYTEYNPSVDMGQYCGACRYYSHRLHVKKYCKRDYSKSSLILKGNIRYVFFLSLSLSYSCACYQSTRCWSMGFIFIDHCSSLQRSS